MSNDRKRLFGAYLAQLREERLYASLRSFCVTNNLDAGNYYRIEAGISPPPRDDLLERYRAALDFMPESAEWQEALRLAAISRGEIPSAILSNSIIAQRLPAIFRTLSEAGGSDMREWRAAFEKVVEAFRQPIAVHDETVVYKAEPLYTAFIEADRLLEENPLVPAVWVPEHVQAMSYKALLESMGESLMFNPGIDRDCEQWDVASETEVRRPAFEFSIPRDMLEQEYMRLKNYLQLHKLPPFSPEFQPRDRDEDGDEEATEGILHGE